MHHHSLHDAPEPELDPRYSDEGAVAAEWTDVHGLLARAELYWLTTVQPDGDPHITPLIGVWLDGAMWFVTGSGERKAANLAVNPACALSTGTNTLRTGTDVVVHGRARRVTDPNRLAVAAGAFSDKYGGPWTMSVVGDVLDHDGHKAMAFQVSPTIIRAFGKSPYSQTTWRMQQPD